MATETCRAFDEVDLADSNALHRFVVGADSAPRRMSAAEVKTLGDPFAALLLAHGRFPRTAEAVVDGLRAAVPKGHALKTVRTFVVGEGSQLPGTQDTAGVDRTMRFIVTVGHGPQGPDVFLSVAAPTDTSGIEVMAWKRGSGGFNYYRSTGDPAVWMFAGNSRDALRGKSRGKGPFESHPSGSLLMKELKSPWQNWHSTAANIPATAFGKNDPRRRHEWFTGKDPGGAYTLEFEAARPAITRWARRRFAGLRRQGGSIGRSRLVMEQILDSPTVNMTTSFRESRALRDGDLVDLPQTFFVDAEALSSLGLAFPPPFEVSGRIYKRALEKFDVRMEDGKGFTERGDTHFCFLALERAFEDQETLREAIEIGLVTRRLAACLLMVDPWNPVFSERRRALLAHVPSTATIADGKSRFSADMAKAILAAAEQAPPESPESEFAERWSVGTQFKGPFNRLLKRYYGAVEAKLKTQAGFDAYFQLLEERRHRFRKLPIAEFPLLLPSTNIAPKGRVMRADGTVGRG
jgi:hypothetical protein